MNRLNITKYLLREYQSNQRIYIFQFTQFSPLKIEFLISVNLCNLWTIVLIVFIEPV